MFVPVPVVAHGGARIAPGEMRTINVEGRPLLLINLEGTYHVVDDTCTHEDCSLGEGYLDDDAVECPCHGARFDVRTGAALSLPATEPLRVYHVQATSGGDLEIDLS